MLRIGSREHPLSCVSVLAYRARCAPRREISDNRDVIRLRNSFKRAQDLWLEFILQTCSGMHCMCTYIASAILNTQRVCGV